MPSDPINWDDMVVVGLVARAHGLRGEVVVNPATDFVEERFRRGTDLWTRSEGHERLLTIASARVHNGRPVVVFDGVSRVEDVQWLIGLELRIPEEALQTLEPGRYYEYQLAGCRVEKADGTLVGAVIRVEGGAGGSRLVVNGTRGEILIPLAEHICTDIDIAAKRIRIDPPEGLLELNDKRS